MFVTIQDFLLEANEILSTTRNKKSTEVQTLRVYYRARAVSKLECVNGSIRPGNHVDHSHVTWRTVVRVYGKFKKERR